MRNKTIAAGVMAILFLGLASIANAQLPSLANISTRTRVETGDNALIGGFIITGDAPKRVLIRAIGPSLQDLGISGALQDPTLDLVHSGASIGFNDNWKDSPERAEIEASTIPPSHDFEAAIVRTLNPGAYTAIMRGANDTSGVGVVEVYDLDTGANSKLANISTRGVVQSGDNVMIAGTIVAGQSGSSRPVLIRAIGPSLQVNGKLADPTLQLVDGNGTVLRANDNWRTDQPATIQATGLAPGNDSEAALVHTVSPAPYTAIVRGAGGSTGIAVVEVYALENAPVEPAPGNWGMRAQLLEANSELACTELNGKIYLLGGYPQSRVTVRTVQVYDIATNHWEPGPLLPQPNNHGMAATVNGKIYLIGGQTKADDPPGTNSYVNTVYELDPATGVWVTKAPMPTARSSGVAVVHNGKIYVAGGRVPRGADFAVYDPAANTWEVLPNLPTQRNHFTGAAINGRIHYVGGRQGNGLSPLMTTVHEVFDPQTKTWSTAAPMLRARSGMNGVMARGCFHVWGGEGPNGMFPDHDYYDARNNTWTSLPNMPLPVHGVYGSAFIDGLIWVPGGGTDIGGSNGGAQHQVYRPAQSCE
ncbi:MAG TPA: kelch repeat-containing protein [Chthoniobacterales bacterium]|nr:kelch repeat-containing protein [Chthoniobacterales bacterium]